MAKFRAFKMYVLITCLVGVSLAMSGCEPLRKKFTRQKKANVDAEKDFSPVLEPEEYPTPEKNPEMNYKQHYALIKVWYKDVWTSLDERGSDKQQKYLLKQIHGHIDEMRKLVVAEKQAKFDDLTKLLSYYDGALDVPAPMRNVSHIHSDLRAFDRALRAARAENIKGFFVPVS